MKGRGITGPLLWLVLAAVGCVQPQTTTGTVESMDVHINVRADGGLDVRETLRLVPAGNRIELARVVQSPYADAVSYRAASVDGQVVEPDAGGLVVEGDSQRLVAQWRRDSEATPTILSLEYDVTAAIGVRRPRGQLEWPVLAAGRGFDVGPMTITLDVPAGAHIYEGTGMAEEGWIVEVASGRITARRERVSAGESATLLAAFDVDRSRVRQGEWEWNLDRQEQYRFALIAAGLFILVVGVGILAQLRVQYPPARADAPDEARRASRSDRQMLSRGLRLSAVVGFVVAAVSAFAADYWLSGLGPALQLIPGSIAFVSVLFLVVALWYRRGSRV
jgi:hypothetical protein